MSKSFSSYTYDDAIVLFGTKAPSFSSTYTFPTKDQRRPPSALAATQFFSGDHWQNSKGFIGQLPPASLPGASLILADIKDAFVSENVVLEVVETHVGGILGREPIWSFLKAEGETDRSNKASFENVTGETLTTWWNKRKALRDLQKATQTALLENIAVRRLFIPKGRFPAGTSISTSNLKDALELIYIETITADKGGVFTDSDTQLQIGVFLFEERNSKGEVTTQCAELSFLNDANETVCKVVRDKGGPTEFGPYQLGGHLLIYQIDRRALITEQVQSSQRALNLARTMMMRNVNMAGSRTTHVTNAQPPKKSNTDNPPPAGELRFPGTFKTGPGGINYVMGYPIYDEQGNVKGYTNPNVSLSDPVPVDTFSKTIQECKEAIYSECHQRHVLIVDKADTSGKAREVARREFERSLKESKTVLDATGRWELETTLRLGAEICGQTSKYEGLRADFNCLIDAGDPDPAKQQVVPLLRAPGGPKNRPLISDETARNMIGVEDAAAELAKIEQESKDEAAELPPPAPIALGAKPTSTGSDNPPSPRPSPAVN